MKLFIIFVVIILADRVAPESKDNSTLFPLTTYTGSNIRNNVMLIEQFKPIKGYEGLYEISNFGRVKSLSRESLPTRNKVGGFIQRTLIERFLSQGKDQRGYPLVAINNMNNQRKTIRTHILVWEHFGDAERDGRKMNIDHIDGDKCNNRIDNLRVLSNRENLSQGWAKKKKNDLPTGVSQKTRGSYAANIGYNNQYEYLGSYKTALEASDAYQKRLSEIRDLQNG